MTAIACAEDTTNPIVADHDIAVGVGTQANEADAVLVVMAAHQKSRTPMYILGSTTKYCLNRCGHTVLVAH